jgi:hypothetical protein
LSRRAWYDYVRTGECESCGRRGWRQAHHVVDRQRLDSEVIYDVANRMLLGSCCHGGHHSYGVNDRRIPLAKVPKAARRFAVGVLGGKEQAADYFRRHYAP